MAGALLIFSVVCYIIELLLSATVTLRNAQSYFQKPAVSKTPSYSRPLQSILLASDCLLCTNLSILIIVITAFKVTWVDLVGTSALQLVFCTNVSSLSGAIFPTNLLAFACFASTRMSLLVKVRKIPSLPVNDQLDSDKCRGLH
jgi:hypothetical protein